MNINVKIKRLEAVLASIIHHNLSAYVKDKTICDAVRSIEDILDYTKRYQIEGRLVSIDFKKAFDSVSRDFLFQTRLSAFHFGPWFKQWIQTCYTNISSCVLNNGFSTAPFENSVWGKARRPALLLFVHHGIGDFDGTINIRSNKNI